MCSYCGSAMAPAKPGFNEVCADCGRDLHACANCRFLSPGARWDCSETVDERVLDKERRNHCDWYQTAPALLKAGEGDRKGRSAADKARADLERLFGGK